MSEGNIMIIEDEKIIQQDIQNRLKDLGYSVPAVASSGKEAIVKAQNAHPDLVLMDIKLKGEMDGVEAGRYIHEQLNIPVIYMSAYSDESTLKRANITESFGYLKKPFETKDLHIAIEMALYKSRTEKKFREMTESILRESESFGRSLLESSPIGILHLDKDGIIRYENPAMRKLMGVPEGMTSPVVGKKITDLDPIKEAGAVSALEGLLKGNPISGEVFKYRSLMGPVTDLEVFAVPLKKKDGSITGAIVNIKDITAQNQKEEQLVESKEYAENIFQSIPDPLAIIDSSTYLILEANKAFFNMYQVSRNDICRKPCYEEIHNLSGPCTEHEYKCPLKTTVETGEPATVEQIRSDNTGEKEYFQVSTSPLKNREGKIDRVVYVTRDITSLRKAEEEIRSALERAQESDRLKSAFLATISHELRTPLNAVIGFSQLIDQDTPLDDVLMMVQRIEKSGEHLLSIIEDIFDVTMIESGQITVKEEEFPILPFMENIQKMIQIEQGKTRKEAIEIVFHEKPGDREIQVYTDKFKLNQILINLLKNALKFTHTGRIDYGFKQEIHNDKPFIRFFVKDTGIGIPEKSREIIFDIFRQADDTHTRQYGGTGIGLSVAKKLTEILGGEIRFDSKEGEGSTFYFTIPFYQKEKTNLTKTQVTPTDEIPGLSGKTILIAEDDDSNFEYLQFILKKLQAKILRATNGLEAIKFAESNPEIDLVLMDIKMPDMSGYEATRQIKKSRPWLPVIAQTAYVLYGDKEKSQEAGCDDYIPKPIQKEILVGILGKYLIKN